MRYASCILPLMVFSLLLLTACNSETRLTTADDLCDAVFKSVVDDDPAAFTALALTDASIAAIAEELEESTQQQREIKEELLGFDSAEIAASVKDFFKKIQGQAQTDGLDLSKGRYQGIVRTKDRFEVPGMACKTVEFELCFDERNYLARIDLVLSSQGPQIFDAGLRTFDTVDVSFTAPQGDPVQAVAGMDLDFEVAFDAETARAQGAWIQIVFDGKNAGMVAGTTLESPYTSDLPGTVLTRGTHALVCRIHPSGQPTEYPLGEATMTIEVP